MVFRALAERMQRSLGQPVVVANLVGGSGTVGAREARNAAPDGYTMYGMHEYIHIVRHAGLSDVAYSDFEPVCLAAATPSVLTAGGHTPWRDWGEFIADARRRPGAITVGATPGTNSQIFPALIEARAGLTFRYVTYEGSAPRWAAVEAGEVDLTNASSTVRDRAAAGRIRFLAVASPERDPALPDVPTLREVGLDVVHEVARGLVVPRATPPALRARLSAACREAAAESGFAAAMAVRGSRVAYLDAADYATYLARADGETRDAMRALGLLRQ
jgi:tripartite-type tricarboxylate transporter receptor subunit TctC